jgi:hypothetical protein
LSGAAPTTEAIRAHHRGTRNAGYAACLAGVLMMIAGRYMPTLPHWLMFAGLAVIGFGWGLFAFALLRRLAFARGSAHGADG